MAQKTLSEGLAHFSFVGMEYDKHLHRKFEPKTKIVQISRLSDFRPSKLDSLSPFEAFLEGISRQQYLNILIEFDGHTIDLLVHAYAQ